MQNLSTIEEDNNDPGIVRNPQHFENPRLIATFLFNQKQLLVMRIVLFAVFISLSFHLSAQVTPEEREVLAVVNRFFDALEKQDTIAIRKMFLPGAQNFAVRELQDSIVVRGQSPEAFRFRRGQIIKERMRESVTEVRIHGRIAMVWAPYDLWVNEVFSHCGVDVFTMIRNASGWKIASVSYTMEKVGCQ